MSKTGELIRGRLNRLAKKIPVPEWGEGDEPMDLYFYPLTVNDAKKINATVASVEDSTREMEYVYYIIFNARDAHGDLVFDVADKEFLSNQPLNVIIDIYVAANGRQGFAETLKK